jgi:hypothetical protein
MKMRISIRYSANRLRAASRVSQRRLVAPELADREQPDFSAIDFSAVHGRHCICERCQIVRASRPARSAA